MCCICGARRKKQETGSVPLRFHKHFTDPPQPLKSIGAQSYSVLLRLLQRVHNNYHPTVALCYNIIDPVQQCRYGRGGNEQYSLIETLQFIVTAFPTEFYPKFGKSECGENVRMTVFDVTLVS